MKIKFTLLCIFTLIIVFSCNESEEMAKLKAVDISKCSIEIDSTQIVNQINTIEGDYLLPTKGETKLIEMRINHISNDSGLFFIHKNIPKLICLNDNKYSIINAIAVAIKFIDHESGELISKYHNEATMLTEVSVGQKIDYYAVFEVPETNQKYQLMLQSKFMEQVHLKVKGNEKH